MKTKYLTEKEIKEELNDYIYNVNIKYATLLDGSWGSGKTYFIKNFLVELEKKYEEDKKNFKKPIYVSLYGLKNVSEIKSKITLSLIKNKTFKQIIPFLDVGFELGSDFISSKTFIKKSDNKLSKILEAFHKIDNLIIFFDDLERCNININSILGYINELVEHNNVKVIIIADETKIGRVNYESNIELKYLTALSDKIKMTNKTDSKPTLTNPNDTNNDEKFEITKDEIIQRAKHIFSEDYVYSEIKEKLIGKVIYYRSDINKIYNIFVNEIITDTDAKETAMKNKSLFLKMLEDYNYYNLRTIQFIFQAFNRLTQDTINLVDFREIKNIYLNDLFSYCAVKSLHIKQGKNSYNWEPDQEFGTVYLGNKMQDYVFKNFVVGFKFVDDYLLHSHINKEVIRKVLNQYKSMVVNELNNPNDPLYKLKTWWIISEENLNLIIDELIIKIKNNEYELDLYSKIVNFLSHIEEMDVCKSKIKTAISELENNIKNNKVEGSYYEDRLFDRTPKTVEIYNKNISKIKSLINDKEKMNTQNTINGIFNDDNWGKLLKEYCESNNSNFLNKKEFAYILDIDLIGKNIRNKSIEEIYEFWYSLQKVYNFSNIKDYYENDKLKLIELKNKLESIKKIDKVKKFVINKVIDFLEDVISNL